MFASAVPSDHSRDLRSQVVEHHVEIENLKSAWARVENKLDRLFWAMLGACAASAGTLLVMILKGKG